MKKIIIAITLFSVALILSSCDDKEVLPTPSTCTALTVMTGTETGDQYFIQDVAIQANCLDIVVQYSGGCEEHEFELRWAEVYGQSNPLTAFLTLWHNGNNDSCEALPTDSLSFDLTSIQVEGEDIIKVKLTGWEGETLSYEY